MESVSEKIKVEINGVEQGMIIRGQNQDNPVLLFVHGGPGMPEYFLSEKYETDLDKYFTVCYWEQRGAGLSFYDNMSANSITVEQLVSDTNEVAKYLLERFGKEKIYLMGHSWGTFIGIQAAERVPEQYYAYIGMSQISSEAESEALAYEYMLEQYQISGNSKMLRKLEKYVTKTQKGYLYSNSYFGTLRDEAMHKLGIGTTHKMKSVISGIFFPVMDCKAYTISEKINIWRGKSFLRKETSLWQKMMDTDLRETVTNLGIPVYFVSGIYDYTVNYSLAKGYLKSIDAPIKGFYSFAKSAHSPLYEEPDKMIEILTEDVLNGTTNLAD